MKHAVYYHIIPKHIIHTVGPRWRGGKEGEAELLASCYHSALALAAQQRFESVAFPSISTGIFGYPIEQASRIALRTARGFLSDHALPRRVTFVCFSGSDLAEYRRAFAETAEGGAKHADK